jgi:3-oxoacyl-[acyl-carrier-protein] synthase II
VNSTRIVVTGIGTVNPLGQNCASSWKSLCEGQSGVSAIDRFNTSAFNTHFAAHIQGFDPLKLDDRKQIRKMDRLVWYALAACDEALNHAKIDIDSLDKNRLGVSWASGNGGMESIDQALLEYAGHPEKPRFSPYFQSKALPDSASGWIASRYGFRGANQLSVAACASSNVAIGTAMLMLRSGMCDAVLAGGSEAPITPSVLGGFGAMKALSTRNDSYTEASRPFSADRDGFVLGEGAAALILETESHALQRKAPILAYLTGYGNANEAGHPTAADESGSGTAQSVEMALSWAGLQPQQISLINPHATSTPNGDLAEYNGLHSVFGEYLSQIPMAATKCMTGHLLGAAGAIEAVWSLMSIIEQKIPAGINLFPLEPSIKERGIQLCATSQPHKIEHVLSHSAGFGGHNASLIFSAPQAGPARP